jgi:2-amino-4-hydroxy-6-hydroxymethyldihydropteridine diphosphokinase
MLKETEFVLLLGSNLGDRKVILASCIQALEKVGDLNMKSSLYETAAWGKTDQPNFLNQVVIVESSAEAEYFLREIQRIESDFERQRNVRWGARTLDIDILFKGKTIINTGNLKIPHPELQNRRFTLVPLNEIIPGFSHPVLSKTISELLLSCNDELEVKKLN